MRLVARRVTSSDLSLFKVCYNDVSSTEYSYATLRLKLIA